MIVRECMTTGAAITTPEASIREAALIMRQVDAGALPVGENDRLIGMITDRDIVTRAVADGQWAKTPVRDVMTPEIQYCFEDEELIVVARRMSELQVRRLPVLNREKRLVGIVSLGDISQSDYGRAAMTLKSVAGRGKQSQE